MKTELKQITYKTLEKISNFIIKEYKELEEKHSEDGYTSSEIKLIELNPYAKGLQGSIQFTAKHFGLHKVNRLLRDYSNLELWNVSIHARENYTFFVELDFSIR